VSRKTAAEALVRMGQCYEKLGDSESRKAYERVLREYGDQKEAAGLARARLGKSAGAVRQTGTLVWRDAKGDGEGRVSPDGRYLSYTDWDSGDLALHEIATGIDRRLTDTKQKKGHVNVFAEGSAISRDGKQVAYNWFDSSNTKAELRLASLIGDPNPRRLYDNPDITWFTPCDWSPDGKWVAVEVQRRDLTKLIGLVSVHDGSLRTLKSVDWRGAGRMFFSPDGKYLGYDRPESDTSRERDVFVLAIDGSREVPAVVHRGQDIMMGWSPDGNRLLFASDRTGSMDLWALPIADGKPRGAPELIKADIGRAESMGLTRSGALYYVISTGVGQRSNIQVASFDFDAGKLISSPTDVTQEYLESNTSPSWSPDGKYLAYLSERGRTGSANTVLVIRSAETSEVVRELRVKLSNLYSYLWAPDGRSLLLQGRDFKGRWGTYRMDVQTGDLSPFIFHERRDLLYPTWSPDGKSLYFSRQISGGKEFALIQRDLASGHERELIRRVFVVANRVSPDGRYLAASSVDPSTNSRTKLLIPTAGGEPREIMRVSAGVEPEALANYGKGIGLIGTQWAPDSRSFLTTMRFNDEKHSDEVWRVPLDGSAPIKLDLGGVIGFQLHPDGRRIAFAVAERGPPRKQEVWVLANFLPALTAKR
jgi:Tol biopolymer transport system component